ncbi:MAG: hypothetical protein AB7U35_09580 [Sphingobium sp.]
MAKGVYDVGNINFNVTNKAPYGTIGLEGKFADSWSYGAHYSYGENDFRSDADRNFSPLFIALAVDAVLYKQHAAGTTFAASPMRLGPGGERPISQQDRTLLPGWRAPQILIPV